VGSGLFQYSWRQLARVAGKQQHRIAYKFRDESRTFADLDERVSRLANPLAERGVGRGDRVATLTMNGTMGHCPSSLQAGHRIHRASPLSGQVNPPVRSPLTSGATPTTITLIPLDLDVNVSSACP
jgi:acyl-CoA synthetase (AMP-forming)/AMP-acid ligase II